MKTLKKLFSVSAIVALLGTLAPMYAFGAGKYSDELEDAYNYAYAHEVTTQETIDKADMYGGLTRVAMAKMIAQYATNVLGLEPDTTKACTFADVSANLDTQYNNGVTKACQLGLMGLDDNGNVATSFNPKGTVTRAQFATAFSRALSRAENGEAIENGNPYYRTHIEYLNKKGIVKSEAEYDVNTEEVRGYVMLMMMRADDSYTPGCSTDQLLACLTADDYDACIAACGGEPEEPENPDEPQGNAEVTVSRVGSTVDEVVAKNAVAKKIGTIKLAAGDEDAVVSSIVISKTGLGSGDVMFEMSKNGVSISKQATLKSNKNTVTVRFSPSLTVKANGSETFDVLASFDAAENSNFTFAVSDVNVANGKSEGTPISLGKVSTTSYSVAEIADADITVTNGGQQKAGETNKTLGTVRVIFPARETTMDGFVITNNNTTESLNDLIANVKAYYNGNEVGKVTVSDEKIVVSDLNLTRSNGESITIELKNDCIFVGSTYKIDLDILENDIVAYETSTNERVRSEADTSAAKLTLNGIDLSINNEITASKTVAPGTSSVELFKAKITANADFEITDYTITFDKPTGITTAMLTGDFNSITAYINGADYELDLDNKTGWTFDKKDSVNVSKGSPIVIRVVGNVKATVAGNSPYQLHFTATTGKNDNNTNITLTSVDVAGHSTTIANGGFTISRQSDTPTNKTVTESTAENMLYFNLRANAEDQILTGLTVSYTGAAATLSGIATKAELMKGNNVVKAVTDASKLGATVVFDGLSEQLKVDEDNYFTIRITLKGGEVENLGKTGQLYLETGNVNVARAADIATATVTTSPKFEGTLYSISSNKPSVAITNQEAKNTFVKFTNNSSYYVELSGVTVEMTRNKAEGTAGYVAWSGTAKLLDSVNGTDVSAASINVPGTDTLSIKASYQNLDSVLNYVLELVDPANTITADDYNVIVKGLEYRFVDKTDATKHSEWISETYNATEDGE